MGRDELRPPAGGGYFGDEPEALEAGAAAPGPLVNVGPRRPLSRRLRPARGTSRPAWPWRVGGAALAATSSAGTATLLRAEPGPGGLVVVGVAFVIVLGALLVMAAVADELRPPARPPAGRGWVVAVLFGGAGLGAALAVPGLPPAAGAVLAVGGVALAAAAPGPAGALSARRGRR